MTRRTLGRSDLSIAPIVFGGNVFGWSADEARSFTLLDAFVDAGFNAIDTADAYSHWVPGNKGGESETIIGRWLKSRGRRDEVLVFTKVGGDMGQGNTLKADYVMRAAEDSLRRLGVETIDLYWLHRDDETTPAEEYLGALESLVRAGKIKAVGASNFGVKRFAEALAASERLGLVAFVAQQPEYNLLSRGIEADLVPLCVRENVAICPYFGLASGFLTGKYRSADDVAKSVRGAGAVKHLQGKGLAVLAALDAAAARHNATCAQIALAWIMAKPAMAAPIASATSVAQLDELMGALRLSLTAADVAELDRASA